MRGTDHQRSGMFSYISSERRVSNDQPLRTIRLMVDGVLRQLGGALRLHPRPERATIHSAGEASARALDAGALHDPRRAHADRKASASRCSSQDPRKMIKVRSKTVQNLPKTRRKRTQSGPPALVFATRDGRARQPDGEKCP